MLDTQYEIKFQEICRNFVIWVFGGNGLFFVWKNWYSYYVYVI